VAIKHPDEIEDEGWADGARLDGEDLVHRRQLWGA
jgi:hypothetical protein